MESVQHEKVFFQDTHVSVTQSRFIARGKTYAMRNMSSVSVRKIEKSRMAPILLLIPGLLLSMPEGLRAFGILMVISGIVWLFLIKDEYSVSITTNSGEADGSISKDQLYIQKIVDGVNEAIIHRG